MSGPMLTREHAERILRAALPAWGIDRDASVEFVKQRENAVFRVRIPDGEYAIRLHRAGYRSDDEILTEVRYVAALGRGGMDVPAIVNTRDGSPLAHVRIDGVEHQLDAQEWLVGGVPLGDVGSAFEGTSRMGSEDFRALGRLAARLHDATAAIERDPHFTRGAWDAEGLVGVAPLWGDPSLLRDHDDADRAVIVAAAGRLHAQLGAASRRPAVFGPIHADFTPENILVVDGRFVLIDFDDFGEGWNMFDLATILFFYTPDPRYPVFRDAVLAGYTEVRALEPDEPALFDALLVARGLTYLGWTAQRREEEGMDFLADDVRRRVVELARAYLATPVSPVPAGEAA